MKTVVLGAQWGDEGKGKMVDLLSQDAHLIVRFQGGNNAGHTLVLDGKTHVFHLIPSGILHPHTVCLLGPGMVIDLSCLFQELQAISEQDISTKNRLWIDPSAHVILPAHKKLDQLRETKLQDSKIGTTIRGIGPAYEDKVRRTGIRISDLFFPNTLEKKISTLLEEKNILFQHLYQSPVFDSKTLVTKLLSFSTKLKSYVKPIAPFLEKAFQDKKHVLFEGAQGTLLDLECGTYPFVTSSHTLASQVCLGSGIAPCCFDLTLGISKAYTTRVGSGPFPTEISGHSQDTLRSQGNEYGATTGRPRRVGWLDLVALRYAVKKNHLTALGLTKVDVLSALEHIQVATAYEINGVQTQDFPNTIEILSQAKPLYQTFPSWKTSLSDLRGKTLKELPSELKTFCAFLESYLKVPILFLSFGPDRKDTLQLKGLSDIHKKRCCASKTHTHMGR